MSTKKVSSETLFEELLKKQLKNIENTKKLQYTDLKRISKYIDRSIFVENICSLWSGYVTNENNKNKGTYINFYFRKRKVALHRLLYINFIGELDADKYLKFTCQHKGKCCNIYHMEKFQYNNKKKDESDENIEKNINSDTNYEKENSKIFIKKKNNEKYIIKKEESSESQETINRGLYISFD